MTTNDDAPRSGLPSLGRYWWTPLGFLTAALLLLLGTPMVVGYRVRQLRRQITDGTDRALVLVNDFEAALATELLARSEARSARLRSTDSTADASLAAERRDAAALARLAKTMDAQTAARLTALLGIEHQRYSNTERDNASGVFHADSSSPSLALQSLVMARQLQQRLEESSEDARARIRGLEQLDVISAASLVPIALASVIVVVWIARRVLTFAEALEHEHAALLRASEARAALLRGVTHDVKNPLGAALGYADLIEQTTGPLNGAQQEMLGRIRRLLGVALETIAELLDLARSDAGQLHVVAVDSDLVTLVREVAEDYRATALERGHTLEIEARDCLSIRTDPSRVRQILANLLGNAIKYTPPNGRLLIRTSVGPVTGAAPPPSAVVEVHDSGPGIPADARDQVFEEFVRLPASENVSAGTGVGLTISKRLATLLGGDLTVGDSPLGGALFTLTLPRHASPNALTSPLGRESRRRR